MLSYCMTSGTEFMVRLHEQLKYFVNKKITTDPGWQGINIYLSGHEVISLYIYRGCASVFLCAYTCTGK